MSVPRASEGISIPIKETKLRINAAYYIFIYSFQYQPRRAFFLLLFPFLLAVDIWIPRYRVEYKLEHIRKGRGLRRGYEGGIKGFFFLLLLSRDTRAIDFSKFFKMYEGYFYFSRPFHRPIILTISSLFKRSVTRLHVNFSRCRDYNYTFDLKFDLRSANKNK